VERIFVHIYASFAVGAICKGIIIIIIIAALTVWASAFCNIVANSITAVFAYPYARFIEPSTIAF